MSADFYHGFHETARNQPRHPALIGPDGVAITYGELDRTVQEIGGRLRRAGLGAGDCVGLHCPNGSQLLDVRRHDRVAGQSFRGGGGERLPATSSNADVCRADALGMVGRLS